MKPAYPNKAEKEWQYFLAIPSNCFICIYFSQKNNKYNFIAKNSLASILYSILHVMVEFEK
jgi:hypothetical protein